MSNSPPGKDEVQMDEKINEILINESGSSSSSLAASSPPPRERIWWVDWSRTQSVWNVVQGHVWWTVRDKLDLPENVYGKDWIEKGRMQEYVVDMGALHTVPVFFMVSGYLTSISLKTSNQGVCNFFKNRALRIWPPFFFGAICLAISRAARKDDMSILNLFFSHLWFLWALFFIQSLALPFCIMTRLLCKRRQNKEDFCLKQFIICFVIHCILFIVIIVVFDSIWNVTEKGKVPWLLMIPLGTLPSLFLFWAPFCGDEESNATRLSKIAGFIWLLFSVYMTLGSVSMCPVSQECKRFAWLSINLVWAVSFVYVCYLLGFCIAEITPDFKALYSSVSDFWKQTPHLFAVIVLLLSAYWPYFTYWSPYFMRRNAFLKTYQAVPKFDNLPTLKALAFENGMEKGRAVSLGISQTFFWATAQFLFAKCFCNYEVHPFIHRHITQSGMILFIFHYIFIYPFIDAVYGAGIDCPVQLLYATIFLTFAASFAIYFVIVSNKYTSALFGVTLLSNFNKNNDDKKEEVK